MLQVGEVVTSPGPDVTTSCASEFGRILELNKEYMAGVGGICSSDFNEWEPLSKFTEEDLKYLRGDFDDDGGNINRANGNPSICSSAAVLISLTNLARLLYTM